LAAALVGAPVRIDPKDIVGKWRDHGGTVYEFHSDLSYLIYLSDMEDAGVWRLLDHDKLELTRYDDPAKHLISKKSVRTIIKIEGFAPHILHTLGEKGYRNIWIKD
jgi:hypothetical protein